MTAQPTDPRPLQWIVEVHVRGSTWHIDHHGNGYIDGEGQVHEFRTRRVMDAFARAERATGNCAFPARCVNIQWNDEQPEGWWSFDIVNL